MAPRAPPRACRRAAATTTMAACAALLALASRLPSLVSRDPSAFVQGAPQSLRGLQRSVLTEQSRALSDAERAAVLRLPEQQEKAAEEAEEAVALPSAGSSKIEMSASQRAALRLGSEEEQAEYIRKLKDRDVFKEAIMQEQAISDGSALGTFGMFFYYLCGAAVLWTWIMNIQKIWQLGHPEPPQF